MLPQLIASFSMSKPGHFIFLSVVLVMLLFIPKFNKLLFSLFIIYINLTNIVIGHIFIHWGYTNANIGPMIETSALSPRYEILEYLTTYVDYRDLLLIVYSCLMLVFLYKFLFHFKHSFKVVKLLSFIATALIILGVGYWNNLLASREPFNIPNKCMRINNHIKIYNARMQYLNSLQEVAATDKTSIYDKIVVIQGESVNKHHMSIYNYDQKTTPFLSSLKSKDTLYIFDAISPANLTRYSLPALHTQANVHNFFELFLHSKSIISDFKTHNYKTYCISNQSKAGKDDSYIASMTQEADVHFYSNLDYASAKPDEVMLPYLNSIKNNRDKELYFIHLMGSHAQYTKRYTDKHILFQNPINIKEEYDNTIYYTDYILQNIFSCFIHKFQNQKILFIYVSDHGEVVSENKHGHGLFPTKDQYDVPFIIYSTIKNNRIDELYEKNKRGYFNLENLNYMVKYISGISEENRISYSGDVLGLEPKSIFNYDDLDFYKTK